MRFLYHYCSVETFFSIIESNSIWLSSLSQSNDYLEGRLVSASVARHALADKQSEDATARFVGVMKSIEEHTDALGFCLSEKGDLLSQWRGYAANATGVSIGFEEGALRRLCKEFNLGGVTGTLSLGPVAYTASEHDLLTSKAYATMKQLMLEAPEDSGKGGIDEMTDLARLMDQVKVAGRKNSGHLLAQMLVMPKLYSLKSPAFAEEKEWRLLIPYLHVFPQELNYRQAGGQILPYIKLSLPPPEMSAIANIFVGPKNRTPVRVLEQYLRSRGFKKFSVQASSATYRG